MAATHHTNQLYVNQGLIMTTIFKSNQVAKKFLSSGLLMSIPLGYRVAMNFNDLTFKQDITAKTFGDLMTLTRNTSGGYIDDAGAYATAGVSSPRFHNDPLLGKGLLVEGGITNLLTNPTAPSTQTITTNITGARWMIVQVWGTGSCAVTIKDSGGATVASGTSTQAMPFMYSPASIVSGATVTVVPTAITHYQAFIGLLPRTRQTKVGSTASATDTVLFSKTVLASLLAVRGELTIIVKKAEITDYADASLAGAQIGTIFQIMQEADTKGVYVARKIGGGTNKGVLRNSLTAETSVDNTVSTAKETFALTINSSTAKMLQNGAIVSLPITEALNLTRLYIGGGITWSTTYAQLIKEVYIYDRVLSDAELLAITA